MRTVKIILIADRQETGDSTEPMSVVPFMHDPTIIENYLLLRDVSLRLWRGWKCCPSRAPIPYGFIDELSAPG
jgi:hypothetical protein